MRTYTGNKDLTTGARPGTKRFMDWILFLNPEARNYGIWASRTVRGKQARSVHQTGRALDIGADRDVLKKIIGDIYQAREICQVEEIHDYIGAWIPTLGFGAGYRCDRDAGGLFSGWRVYEKNTIGKGGSWVHVELAPAIADSVELVDEAFTKILEAVATAPAEEPKKTTRSKSSKT